VGAAVAAHAVAVGRQARASGSEYGCEARPTLQAAKQPLPPAALAGAK
jgi:hypothetical protein